MNRKKIYLVRHGQTTWSLSGKHTGHTDLSLTEEGKEESLALKSLLVPLKNIGLVLCSPLKRAKETCALTGYLEKATIEPLLKEWDYGHYEGKTTEEIHRSDPTWNIFTHGAPGGESKEQIEARVKALLDKLEKEEKDVLLFSSGHFLRSLAVTWLGLDLRFGRSLVTSTASISILGYERSNPALLLWNCLPDFRL